MIPPELIAHLAATDKTTWPDLVISAYDRIQKIHNIIGKLARNEPLTPEEEKLKKHASQV